MATASVEDLGRRFGRLFETGSAVGLSDGELLERFAQRADDAVEAAFETLLTPPVRLLEATVAAVIRGMPNATARAMANVMLRSLLLARLTTTIAVLSIVLITTGVGLALRGAPPGQPPRTPDSAAEGVASAQNRSALLDLRGDPLPEHARARLGAIPFHEGSPVKQVLYTPDSKSLVTVDLTHIVRVWNAKTGQIIGKIGDAEADFREVSYSREIALSRDGKTLATIEKPGRLRLWDITTGHEQRRLHQGRDEIHTHPISAPDGRMVATSVHRFDEATQKSESFVDVWDTSAPTERRRRIAGDWVLLWDFEFSPDNKTLATASRDTEVMRGNTLIGPDKGSTRLWDVATGRERKRFPVSALDVKSLAISPDGRLLAAAVTDGTVRIYDLTSEQERLPRITPKQAPPAKQEVQTPPHRPTAIAALEFSPDGSILAGGDANVEGFSLAAIHIWDVARSRELHRVPAHQYRVASLSFSPDGKILASSGAEPVLRLWEVATGREAFAQSGHRSAIRSLVVCATDATVFTGGSDGTVRQWNPSSGRELGQIAQLDCPVESLALAPDGKTLIVGGQIRAQPGQIDGFAVWSVAEHREIRRLSGLEDRHVVQEVAYSPDGGTVASAGRIWDARSGTHMATLRHRDPEHDQFLSFCPIFYTFDGKEIITAEPDGVRFWEIATGRELRRAVEWSNCHDRATLSPDGRFLATRGPNRNEHRDSEDWPYRLWELASGQEIETLDAHGDDDLPCPFSPDGRFLATAGRDQGTTHASIVRVWDLAKRREVRRFAGHRGGIRAVAFMPDGRSVISAGEDATALVWDLSDLSDRRVEDTPLTAEGLRARWTELAGNDARAAYRAAWALSTPSAVPFLRDHLRPAMVPDPEGIAAANGPTAPPEVLRTLRAMCALERAGTPEAHAVLEGMARGNPTAIETRDASSALARLNRRLKAQVGAVRR
jgi:WD40 repeat protein